MIILKGFPVSSNTMDFNHRRYPTNCKVCKVQQYDQTRIYDYDENEHFYYCEKCLNPPKQPKQLLFKWE